MRQQILYILAFKDEPLIKVGIAADAYVRSLALGLQRFDLAASYVVRSNNHYAIRVLERNLKTFFAEHQRAPVESLSSGNTETFPKEILPNIIEAIEVLRRGFPTAEFVLEHDISALGQKQGGPSCRRLVDYEKRKTNRLEKERRRLEDRNAYLRSLRRPVPLRLRLRKTVVRDQLCFEGETFPAYAEAGPWTEETKVLFEPPTHRRIQELLFLNEISGCTSRRQRVDGTTLYMIEVYSWVEIGSIHSTGNPSNFLNVPLPLKCKAISFIFVGFSRFRCLTEAEIGSKHTKIRQKER